MACFLVHEISGAFKFRGACNAVYSLTDDEAARGVVTHSRFFLYDFVDILFIDYFYGVCLILCANN